MIEPDDFANALVSAGVSLFVGVPDSLLKDFNRAAVDLRPGINNIVAANEGAAVGIAAGHFVATGRPSLVYMQNSGLGNAINPLASLTAPEVYGIPMVLLVGWRGEPGLKDAEQHLVQGRITPTLLDSLGIPTFNIDADRSDWRDAVQGAVDAAIANSSPAALLVSQGTFSKSQARGPEQPAGMTREGSIEAIVESVGSDAVLVSTTGFTSRSLFQVRSDRGESGRDFLMVGSMGHALSIALGISVGSPDTTVICIDGDGAMAMHMGAMTSVGQLEVPNLGHILLDNGVHESVGGQPSSLAGSDSVAIALACGYVRASVAATYEELQTQLRSNLRQAGPWFLRVKTEVGLVQGGERPTSFNSRLEELRRSFDG